MPPKPRKFTTAPILRQIEMINLGERSLNRLANWFLEAYPYHITEKERVAIAFQDLKRDLGRFYAKNFDAYLSDEEKAYAITQLIFFGLEYRGSHEEIKASIKEFGENLAELALYKTPFLIQEVPSGMTHNNMRLIQGTTEDLAISGNLSIQSCSAGEREILSNLSLILPRE